MSASPGAESAAVRPRGDDVLALEGTLSFDTAPDLYAAGADWVRAAAGPVTFDLAGVGRIDSAGLALLVEWMRLAKGRGVRLANVPAQARDLIRVYGLSAALGVTNDAG